MLFVNIGVMLGTYIGIKLLSSHHTNKTSPVPGDEKATQSKNPQLDKRHFNISNAAIGMAAISYVYPPVRLLSVGLTTTASAPIFKEAEHSLRVNRQVQNDTLSSIVTIVCIGSGLYFPAALQTWIYHFGTIMVNKSQNKATRLIGQAFEQQPSKVWILKDQTEIEVSLHDLEKGDIVVIKAGEVIAIDGIITKGMAMVDQQALTGEPMPIEKAPGDHVLAATILVSGQIQVKVKKTGQEATVAKLNNILQHTRDFKSSLQLKGESWSNKISLPLLTVSAIAWPFLGTSSAASLLFSIPSNTIRVLPALQTFNHITLASKNSILIKDGRVLEELVKVDTVLFDKTGTLTKIELEVGQIISCDDLSADEILRYAAIAESRLNHPLARAIVKQAELQHLHLPDTDHANYQIGYGVTVQMNGQTIQVGSARFMETQGIMPTAIKIANEQAQQTGDSLVMVAVDQKLKGAIEIQPQLRPEVKAVMADLRQRGIKQLVIVSGDHQKPTQKLAKELGMDDYFYEVLPQEKAQLIRDLQAAGHKVCFIGDGLNDAVAMKQANVSICLSDAASITSDMAQVLFLDDNLSHLCELFDISKQLNSRLQNSMLFWGGFGVSNTAAVTMLHFGLTKSTLLFGTAFGLGVGQAMLPLL
ncbi:MAG: heavy metal translocating P-type ATPase [Pseudomonadota bacterium]